MNDALELVSRVLVGDLERRFPYAAALISGATGVQITDTGAEQSATEVSPKRGVVFTLYDGSQFLEYATATLAPDRVAREVKAWAATLTVRPSGSPSPRKGKGSGDEDASSSPFPPRGGTMALASSSPSPVGEGAGGVRFASDSPLASQGEGGWGGEDTSRAFETPMELDPDAVSLIEKLQHVRDTQRRARALDPRIVQAQAQYTDHTRETTYIGRGRVLTQRVTRTRMLVLIAVSDGAQVRYHFLNNGGTGGFELARVRDEALRNTLDVALRLLDAEKIEPGEYDIVTDNSISGVLAHESFGHGVELDLYPKGRALSAKYLTRPVAAPALQMFDDPGVAGAHGSYFFDDEGELARPTQILRDGVFVQPISDLASSLLAHGAHTPNGRRQDFTRKVYARMSNTFFAAGDTSPADIIAGVERGVYLRECESGMEDPMGWGIQITAHYGEEIIAGRLTGRLFAPVAITGYVPDVLQSIRAIGDDFQLDPGTCGKGHKEMVPVSSGGPHLRARARLG